MSGTVRSRGQHDVLIIDNYDSFTWNLVQYVAQLGPVRVLRNNAVDLDALDAQPPSHILVSPGPKGPADAGVSLAAIRRFAGRIPILGVCLGHQAINEAFGGTTVRAPVPVHGKTTRIHTDGQTIFEGLPRQFEVCRYHSLMADPTRLGAGLTVSAWTDDGVIMGLRHAELGVEGVQFHPESFRTEHGMALLRSFFERYPGPRESGSPLSAGVEPHRASADRGRAAPRAGSRPTSTTERGDPLPFGPDGFWRCVEALRREDGFVLLASTLPDTRQGRWSIAAFSPVERVVVRGCAISVFQGETTEVYTDEPLVWLEARAEEHRGEHPPSTSNLPFVGGYLGYFGYEAGRRLELCAAAPQETPDIVLGYYNQALILNHHTGEVHAFGARVPEILLLAAGPGPDPLPDAPRTPAESALSDTEYLAAIGAIHEFIRAGDVYQVNLTQRVRAPLRGDPWHAFRRLARDNAAPFAAYLNFPELTVVSASPERFVAVDGDRVETRPIKGTVARGATPDADAAALDGLRASPKDRAELTMIVDLLRNDLGRVCVPGSVAVAAFPEHESYASVHHLVATIEGTLGPGESVWSLLRAALPGGSITGAPKIRAMEIIDALEGAPRGVYTGCIGYIGADGRADLNIAIRTAIVVNDMVYVHGGGGVVIDSVPEAELAEAQLKMRRVLDAFGMG
jgi:para-aminobenzoate synthetase